MRTKVLLRKMSSMYDVLTASLALHLLIFESQVICHSYKWLMNRLTILMYSKYRW